MKILIRVEVSVPSTGRSGLQLRMSIVYSSGRIMVSVPSTGRSGLQHALRLRRQGVVLRFSTLYGSKWVATVSK